MCPLGSHTGTCLLCKQCEQQRKRNERYNALCPNFIIVDNDGLLGGISYLAVYLSFAAFNSFSFVQNIKRDGANIRQAESESEKESKIVASAQVVD